MVDENERGPDDNAAIPTKSSPSGCPIQNSDSSNSGFWSRWRSTRPIDHVRQDETITAPNPAIPDMCPVKDRQLPASIEESANHSQLPAAGQRLSLSTNRVTSSIPRNAPLSAPEHQPSNSQQWVYPSEQQFYNAMLRKGHRPPIESIPSVLRIHNAVNERSWSEVRRWERAIWGCDDPKLVRFEGRPNDLSPKAWCNSRLRMTQEPFDRHDWFVQGEDGGDVRRYVIDFYQGKGGAKEGAPPAMYLDVRPALDKPSVLLDRMVMLAREVFPGIAAVWDASTRTSSSKGGQSPAREGNDAGT